MMSYIPELECFLINGRSPIDVWRPLRTEQQQCKQLNNIKCVISWESNPCWGSRKSELTFYEAMPGFRLIGNGNNWWNHTPHHVPSQKWLFTKKGAGRNLYYTDMSQGMLAGQHIHTFTTSIHNAGSMLFNQPCFGRLPCQLRKSWQHETEPRWGGGRELESFSTCTQISK